MRYPWRGGAARAAYRFITSTRPPFEPTHYVWSRGLALLCDHNGGVDFVRNQMGGHPALPLDPAAYAGIDDGDLVWVRHIALPQFVRDVLPSITKRFALVTGDEDWAIPSDFGEAHELLAKDELVCWFTQNYDGSDAGGKITGIPIGLDFHTISNRRKWGHWPASPAEQEAELMELAKRMPRTADRQLRVHADFHFTKQEPSGEAETRHDVQSLLERNPLVDFQGTKVSRIDLWITKTQYAFVVSPHGNGLDCHRTWESLVLGNIVIVKRSSLDDLYDQLPVVIVDDWNEITENNLQQWAARHADAIQRPEVQERLTNRYWIDHMRRKLAAGM